MTTGFNVTADGQWVSAEFQRIAQIIHDYDPTLSLAWVPPKERELNEEYPFAIVGTDTRGLPYVAMRIRENEMDHRVLERLWTSDNIKGDPIAAMDAKNAALEAIELQKRMDEIAEEQELAAWMIKAPVGARHNGAVLR